MFSLLTLTLALNLLLCSRRWRRERNRSHRSSHQSPVQSQKTMHGCRGNARRHKRCTGEQGKRSVGSCAGCLHISCLSGLIRGRLRVSLGLQYVCTGDLGLKNRPAVCSCRQRR